jgi:hypothetical protein
LYATWGEANRAEPHVLLNFGGLAQASVPFEAGILRRVKIEKAAGTLPPGAKGVPAPAAHTILLGDRKIFLTVSISSLMFTLYSY